MELTGGAYFFAFIGFLLVVVAGWLFPPRASFVVTMAVFVHKMGFINLADGKGFDTVIGSALVFLMVVFGLCIDILIIRKFFKEL